MNASHPTAPRGAVGRCRVRTQDHAVGQGTEPTERVGSFPLVTLFCYPADAGQDYEIIGRAGGMRDLIVDDGIGGWERTPNPRYVGRRRAAR